MDKRWIGIIIILLAGLGCMYIIVDHSTSVGSAVSVISDVTITLPHGYINSEDGSNYCVLYKKETNETMRIKCLKDAKSYINEYNANLNYLKQQKDIKIHKNFTNDTLGMIEYENQSSANKKFISMVYFDKCEHTFSIQMEQFTDDQSKENTLNFIIDNMKYDFKQRK
jgi:ABC-type lipoprotein release transport system permease subunit